MNLDILKGLLILFVIFDHNDFARSVVPEFLRGMSFHVVGFLAIPFLRDAMRPASGRSLAYVFRLYYPFLLLTVALGVAVTLLTAAPLWERVQVIALALYNGNFYSLKAAANMGLLWYLPSFISLVMLYGVIEAQGRHGKAGLIGLLVLLHGVLGPLAPRIQDYIPLGLLPALYALPLCYAVAQLHKRIYERLPVQVAVLLAVACFALVKSLQVDWRLPFELGAMEVAGYDAVHAMLVNDLEGITGALMLFQLSRLPLGKTVAAFGAVSLQVYLMHAFIALAVAKAVVYSGLLEPAALRLAGSFVLTALLTLMAARLLMASPLRRWLFPRDLAELAGRRASLRGAGSLD